MTPWTQRILFLVAAPLLVLASACNEAPTAVAPQIAPEASLHSTSNGGPDLSVLATFDRRPSITIAWARKWIGPEGGRLDFQGFAIEVPAGAVDRVTQFSIRLPVDPKASERVVAEFGPHGATFLTPLFIEFPFAGTSLEGSDDATVVWWNDGWVDMGAQLIGGGTRLRTSTDHFSTYGTTQRGGVTVSGG
jgi:hypothetical protein